MAENKSFLGSFLVIFCFIVGCMFLYWAVQYWVANTFDQNRYDIHKIQPAGGGDSLSFWKLDHRTGNVEYCSIDYSKAADKDPEFVCVASKSEENVREPQPEVTATTPATTADAPVMPGVNQAAGAKN